MYITDIWIKFWQNHDDLHIKLTQGFNAIIGETETGKSAIIRALALIFTNKPRSGEVLYKQWFKETIPDLKVKFDTGTTIRRHKRKYYVNNIPLKAFNQELPTPISELIPLSDANWQRQLDSHFMILKTGGNAAKSLNKVMGIEDYLLLVAEIKKRIYQNKKDSEYLTQQNTELKLSINKLEIVPSLLDEAKALQNSSDLIIEYDRSIDQLVSMINRINLMSKAKQKKKFLQNIIEETDSLIKKILEQRELEHKISKLSQLITDLREDAFYIKQKAIYQNTIDEIKRLQSQLNKYTQLNNKIIKLENLISSITFSYKQHKQFTKESKEAKDLLDKKFKKLGYCPLCNTKDPKGNHVCT